VQVDPIKLSLKAPGTKCVKLKYDGLLSSFAFTFNLRRYATRPYQSLHIFDESPVLPLGQAVQLEAS